MKISKIQTKGNNYEKRKEILSEIKNIPILNENDELKIEIVRQKIQKLADNLNKITENKAIIAKFHAANNTYEIKYKSGEEILKRKLKNGVEIRDKNFDFYIFSPDGRIGNAGTVKIKKASEYYILAVSPVTSEISLRKDK